MSCKTVHHIAALLVVWAIAPLAMADSTSDAFAAGTSFGQSNNANNAANINSTNASTYTPNYTNTNSASTYYGNGQGVLDTPASTDVSGCLNTPGSADPDPYTHGKCEGVRMLGKNENNSNNTYALNPATDPLIAARNAAQSNSATYLGSMNPQGSYSGCMQQTVTTPATYTTQTCVQALGVSTQTCDRTLIVSIPGTIPATPDYSCASGQILIGQQCQSPSIAALVNYSCSAGSSLNGTTCQPAPSTATASYSCGSGQTLSGTSCQAPAANATLNYSCNIGDTLNGSTCTPPSTSTAATANYSCASGSTLEGSMCQGPTTQGPGVAATGGYLCPFSGSTLNGTTCSVPATYLPPLGRSGGYYTCSFGSLSGNSCLYPAIPPTATVPMSLEDGWGHGPWSCTANGNTFYSSGSVQCEYNSSSSWSVTNSSTCDSAVTQESGNPTVFHVGYAGRSGNVYTLGDILLCSETVPRNYSCPSGYTLSGSTCYPPAVTPPPTPANVSYSCSSGTLSGTSCVTNGVPYNATSTYTCPSGTTVSGSQCVSPVTSATASYSCPTGNSLVNSQCYPPPVGATTSYTCPASYIINGTSCAPPPTPATITYTCAAGMTLSGSSCQPAPTTSWQDGCSALEAQAQ